MTVIADLKKNLQACKDELPEMRKLFAKLEELCGMPEERDFKKHFRVYESFHQCCTVNRVYLTLRVEKYF